MNIRQRITLIAVDVAILAELCVGMRAASLDPDNFTDHRLRPVTHISRFLHDFEEDKKFVITVGDLELNMSYDKLRLEMDQVEWVAEYLH